MARQSHLTSPPPDDYGCEKPAQRRQLLPPVVVCPELPLAAPEGLKQQLRCCCFRPVQTTTGGEACRRRQASPTRSRLDPCPMKVGQGG
eukprot:NODE_1344_length_1462_cov_4.163482_g593_i1.p3 GENE.NODE_1344_length_1462_cov_4.163482_g593_i1~~NODE_1344_length_1462_cov_4.163482_g593_i1.p3  ORF type:complete len:89 (+),score=5.10 NODE_1344_length_1462_cov_4.163482_g593_i1:531-797(+)